MTNKSIPKLEFSSQIESIENFQTLFLQSKGIEDRKTLGQFFSGAAISNYMASLIKSSQKSLRILDAGAGAGILTSSVAFSFLQKGCSCVHAVLYELDETVISILEKNLKIIQYQFEEKQAAFTYEIHCKNFITDRPDKKENFQSFDISVINPPYFKYNVQESFYAKAVKDLYNGDPNIYASFMAVAMSCLKNGGELITITPRSFTNGLYFKGFRKYLLDNSSIELMHIFKKRDKIFKKEDYSVLQENIICKFVKGEKTKEIIVRSSDSDENISQADEKKYPINLIIDLSNNQNIIRVPESISDAEILKNAEKLPTTFQNAGYFISTGPVVGHRTLEYIVSKNNLENSVPLYRAHNITPLIATWTGRHPKDACFKLEDGHNKHTSANDIYVLLKRFSSKDEKSRLVSAVYDPNKNDSQFIAFDNKINYIGIDGEKLSLAEAYGLCAVFNSTFMDKYFRCVSGNTQVNATEIRVMKFPSRYQIQCIGAEIQNSKNNDVDNINAIVETILKINVK